MVDRGQVAASYRLGFCAAWRPMSFRFAHKLIAGRLAGKVLRNNTHANPGAIGLSVGTDCAEEGPEKFDTPRGDETRIFPFT